MKKKFYNSKSPKSVHSNCGVFGIFNHPQAAIMTYYGLHALQHRGQESAGIVTSEFKPEKNRYHFNVHKDFGLTLNIFTEKILKDELKGNSAIGHNRYSTSGSSDKRVNIQPFSVVYKEGNLALSHNGNLTNTNSLRLKLQQEGTIFQTTSDSEIILHLIAKSNKEKIEGKLVDVFRIVKGAYSICILTDDKLIAVRDPQGVRPFSMGKLDNSYVFASETSSFDIINADYIRDVKPGEIIIIDREVTESGNLKSYRFDEAKKHSHCIFEFIYFSRPDSNIFGEKVDKVRRMIGSNLAIEKPPPDKDNPDNEEEKKVIVINVPDSSNTATIGYISEVRKKTTNIKHEIGLIRSHYVGRTFIQPGQNQREMRLKTKFSVIKGILENRKVVIVDDSIVRGNTLKLLVKLIRKANPKEIHLRITSPPIISPCFYGMDFPSKEELIAYQHDGNVEKIKEYLGVDSLEYLSLDTLLKSVPYSTPKSGYCTACFSCNYPIPIEDTEHRDKEMFDI
ncbi:MAG: amidophosphoribosyltransferase [Ignavibacteria bacterium]|nr:amidophosphoribosyltransferase [Ignavibacteria bacterium]